jgi:beta-N-acetylhexosaminidase
LPVFGQKYSLADFFVYDATLEQKIDEIFDNLNDTSRVGQMIIPAAGRLGKSEEHINSLDSKKIHWRDDFIKWHQGGIY